MKSGKPLFFFCIFHVLKAHCRALHCVGFFMLFPGKICMLSGILYGFLACPVRERVLCLFRIYPIIHPTEIA